MNIDRSMFCRGNGGTCECEEFRWPDDGPGTRKPICYECDHGISKHPGAPAPRPDPLPLPPPPNPPPSLPVPNASTAGMTNSRVQDLFSNLTGSEPKVQYQLSNQTTAMARADYQSSNQTTAVARAEAIATFAFKKNKSSIPGNTASGSRKVGLIFSRDVVCY